MIQHKGDKVNGRTDPLTRREVSPAYGQEHLESDTRRGAGERPPDAAGLVALFAAGRADGLERLLINMTFVNVGSVAVGDDNAVATLLLGFEEGGVRGGDHGFEGLAGSAEGESEADGEGGALRVEKGDGELLTDPFEYAKRVWLVAVG